MKSIQMSIVKAFALLILGFVSSINVVQAGTAMKVYLTTGGDDLRGGNNAFVTINFTNGSTSREYLLGGGFANNSLTVKTINMDATISSLADIRDIVIRHDGSPRAGQPFDTYDNWNLDKIRVTFNVGGAEQEFFSFGGVPLIRFTGAYRTHIFAPQKQVPSPPTYTVKVFLTTGSDDLRGGNNAYMTIKYANGQVSPEYTLGGGFGQNSFVTKTVNLNRAVSNVTEIQSITIRHDGSPRAGQPFDGYDNWDMQAIRVALVLQNGEERNVINPPVGNPLVRFTGSERIRTFGR